MQTVTTIADVRAQVADWKRQGLRVAFVPTMGNLHAGHISLVTEARRRADRVVASIFVNPTQFGPSEDFDAYPRTLAADQEKLAAASCDLLFAPTVDEMYPRANSTWVDVDQLGDFLCGANRPGHFRGVTTVVSKLLHIVQPDIACFGEKDFQQLAIIRRMVEDLFFPVEIVGVDTAREDNGLAMSSRNGYLSAAEKQQAATLQQVLQAMCAAIEAGESDFRALESKYSQTLSDKGFKVDYLTVADADTLAPAQLPHRPLVIAVAAKLGSTRLIDNVRVGVERDR
ncbi:MAG: pantoate--beta-alanine ligase [Alcanivoracaceae bacterium]|nr:pantoate--beta-alanine ligase [Alcanivoracaceae bacterium]